MWVVACAQHIKGHAHLPVEGRGVEVCHLLIHVTPQVLIALAEPATKASMEDHVKCENTSLQT